MKKKNRPKVYTCKMIAEIMGFTPDYIRRLCGQGKIKAMRYGQDWIVLPADLDAWRLEREKKNESGNSERSDNVDITSS